MCGRYGLYLNARVLDRISRLATLPDGLEPRFNIPPGQQVLTIGCDRRGARAGLIRWGVHETVAGRPRNLINLRAEGIQGKPYWRERLLRSRMLAPASHFFEWKRATGGKDPVLFRHPAGEPLFLAGLFGAGTAAADGASPGLVLLTTRANQTVSLVHHRMPVILAEEEAQSMWLDPQTPLAELAKLLRPAADNLLQAVSVSRRVNRGDIEGGDLIEPVPA